MTGWRDDAERQVENTRVRSALVTRLTAIAVAVTVVYFGTCYLLSRAPALLVIGAACSILIMCLGTWASITSSRRYEVERSLLDESSAPRRCWLEAGPSTLPTDSDDPEAVSSTLFLYDADPSDGEEPACYVEPVSLGSLLPGRYEIAVVAEQDLSEPQRVILVLGESGIVPRRMTHAMDSPGRSRPASLPSRTLDAGWRLEPTERRRAALADLRQYLAIAVALLVLGPILIAFGFDAVPAGVSAYVVGAAIVGVTGFVVAEAAVEELSARSRHRLGLD